MKWKKSYSIAFGIAIVFLSPLGVYLVHHMIIDIPHISSNPQSWAAFGGMYYGLVIAALTGFNIWLVSISNKANSNRDKALKQSEVILDFQKEFPRLLNSLNTLNNSKLKDYRVYLANFEKSKLTFFSNRDIHKVFDKYIKLVNKLIVTIDVKLLPLLDLTKTQGSLIGLYQYRKISNNDYNDIAKDIADCKKMGSELIDKMRDEIQEKFHS